MVFEKHTADYGHHRSHTSQGADDQRRAPAALVQIEHVSDGGQGKAFPCSHSETLDKTACEESVVVVLLGADDADDGPQSACHGCEEELWAFSIFLGKD